MRIFAHFGICLALTVACFITISYSYAQNGQGGGTNTSNNVPSADLYLSPRLPDSYSSSLRFPPSGAINISPNENNGPISNTFDPTLGAVGEISNSLGCAGVGQGEFTSGLFNMPEVYTKFQQDVQSSLSKQLLSLNFVMPQTSALFDQLNTIGNQRYDQFQRGCTVTPVQADAKQNYMLACVEKLIPERETIIEETNNQQAQTARIPEDQIGPMAYAQAWEICANQYVSNTTAMEVRTERLTAYYTKLREAERVDLAIRPLLCQITQEGDEDGAGCWAKFLIPQVRICLGNNLEGGCTEGVYGVKEPLVPMQRLFDTMRFIMENDVIQNRVVPFNNGIRALNASTRQQAAREATIVMSTTKLTGSSTTLVGQVAVMPTEAVRDFQLNYLSCKNNDVLNGYRQYKRFIEKQMNQNGATSDIPDLLPFNFAVIESTIEKMELAAEENSTSDEADIKAVSALLESAMGCTANQSIPIFDPNITAALQTTCSDEDIYAFYSIAGNDVAAASTRDVYRYLNFKLKQAYTRLMTEAMVPVSDTTNTSVSPTYGPELNAKFAQVVKDVMIPYTETQIERLNDINASRGQLGQLVNEIYASKNGCNPKTP